MAGLLTSQLLMRRDTAANWTSTNPVLGEGEIGHETNTGFHKIGDGSTAWNALIYYHGPPWLQGLDGGKPDTVYAVGPDGTYHGTMSTDPGPIPPPDSTAAWTLGDWNNIDAINTAPNGDILVVGQASFGDTEGSLVILSPDLVTSTFYDQVIPFEDCDAVCMDPSDRVYVLKRQQQFPGNLYPCYYSDPPYTTWTQAADSGTAFAGNRAIIYDSVLDLIVWGQGTKMLVSLPEDPPNFVRQKSVGILGTEVNTGESNFLLREQIGGNDILFSGSNTLGGAYTGQEKHNYIEISGDQASVPVDWESWKAEYDAFGPTYPSKAADGVFVLPDESRIFLWSNDTLCSSTTGLGGSWGAPFVDLDSETTITNPYTIFSIPAFGKVVFAGRDSGNVFRWYESTDGETWTLSTDTRITNYEIEQHAQLKNTNWTKLNNGGVAWVSYGTGNANIVVATV